MYSGLEYRNRSIVGLIVVLALLFFCGNVAKDSHDAMEAARLEAEAQKGKDEEEKRVIDPNKPMIALTFDDGPGKYTMQLLEQLEKYQARASFFMLGLCIEEYPEEIQKMQELGCDIGNHTMNHKRLAKLDDAKIAREIRLPNKMLKKIIGQEATFVRPPYGVMNEVVQEKAGAPIVMWSVDTRDWETKKVSAVKKHVLSTVQDGDIVLLHDIHETTVKAAMELIPTLIKKGYQLVTVSEMAEARGVELENGEVYYHFRK